jgi:hypothetical protein
MANIGDANSRCILLRIRFGFRFCALLAFISPIEVYLTFAAFIKLHTELRNGPTILASCTPVSCDIHPCENADKCPPAIYCTCDACARNNETHEGFGIRERAWFLSSARHFAGIDRRFKFRRKRLAIKASFDERSISRISALFPEFNRD